MAETEHTIETSVTVGDSDQVQWYGDRLVFEAAQVVDLDLTVPTRRIIHAGPLFRQNDPLKRSVNGWKELWVVLFDNYLIMTKPKGKGRDVKYVVWKPPVRVEFITLGSSPIRPVQRSNTLSWMMRTGRDSPDPTVAALRQAPDGAHIDDNHYPFSFHCHGKHGGAYTLYARTVDERTIWRRKVKEAIALRRTTQEETNVFRVETITTETTMSRNTRAPPPGFVAGSISCSFAFTSNDGRDLVALGSDEGVWIGLQHQPESFKRVISLKLVTRLAYLVEYGFMIILADHALYAIDIESIVPSNGIHTQATTAGLQMISQEGKQIHFFAVGHQDGRTLIIMKLKKGLDSVFRVVEVGQSGDRQFRVYREFFIPADSHDVLFLKTKICVLCPRGFEMMSLTDFFSVTIPTEEDMRRLGKKVSTCRPLAMFRIREDEFFLCYEEFGLYIDKRGSPSRSPPLIEWEGVASHAAWHAPYIVLFGPSFVEVRHVESGRLAQVIPGSHFRCLWDGRNVVRRDATDEFEDSHVPHIHAVMEDSDPASFSNPGSGPRRQRHAVVLVPTERLVVPGTRYSPSLLSVADTLPPYVP